MEEAKRQERSFDEPGWMTLKTAGLAVEYQL